MAAGAHSAHTCPCLSFMRLTALYYIFSMLHTQFFLHISGPISSSDGAVSVFKSTVFSVPVKPTVFGGIHIAHRFEYQSLDQRSVSGQHMWRELIFASTETNFS